MGGLARVLPGVFRESCEDLGALVVRKERFYVFVDLAYHEYHADLTFCGNYPIPQRCQEFPPLRSGNLSQRTLRVYPWFVWDAEQADLVDRLTDDQWDLSLREIPDFDLLVERVFSDWSPRTDSWFGEANNRDVGLRSAELLRRLMTTSEEPDPANVLRKAFDQMLADDEDLEVMSNALALAIARELRAKNAHMVALLRIQQERLDAIIREKRRQEDEIVGGAA
jgi:hypothetical protein